MDYEQRRTRPVLHVCPAHCQTLETKQPLLMLNVPGTRAQQPSLYLPSLINRHLCMRFAGFVLCGARQETCPYGVACRAPGEGLTANIPSHAPEV